MLTESTTISIGLLIVIAGLVINIVINVVSRKRADNEKRLELEKKFIELNVKLDSMRQSSIQLLQEINQQSERTEHINEITIKTDERIKTLFSRLDDHEERITRLEGR